MSLVIAVLAGIGVAALVVGAAWAAGCVMGRISRDYPEPRK